MSEKIFLDDKEDEITYKTTDFLNTSDDQHENYSTRKRGGLLIFFVILFLIASLLSIYLYVTKSKEIKSLKIAQMNLESSSKITSNSLLEKVSALENQLENATNTIESLTLKNRDNNDQLLKTQTSLSKTEADKKNIQSNLDNITQNLSEKDAVLKSRETELNKTRNERKRAEDDLKDAGERITKLENDVSFWQKKFEKLNKDQTDAVNEILASAQVRQKAIEQMEQDLLKAYEKMELYYSLIGWEENFKLTNRLPLSKLTQKPVLQTTSRPEYPQLAQKKKIEGMVILKCVLSEDGRFSNVDVLYSPQGNTQLGEAAKAAVAKYRYKPAQKDGLAVKVMLVVPVDFQLKSNTES